MGRQPTSFEVQKSLEEQFLQNYAIESIKREIDRLVWVSIPEAIGAVERLSQALEHPNSYVRVKSAHALGRIGDIGAIELLLKHLSDRASGVPTVIDLDHKVFEFELNGEPTVREACAEALKKIGWEPKNEVEKVLFLSALRTFSDVCRNPSATGVLVELLWDGDLGNELSAIRSLGALKSVQAVPDLIRKLSEVWHRDIFDDFFENRGIFEKSIFGDFPKVKRRDQIIIEIAKALGKIGDTRAVEPLIAVLQHEDNNVRVEIVPSGLP